MPRQPRVLTGRRSGQARSSTFSLISVLPSMMFVKTSVLIPSSSHGYQCMNFPRPLLIQTLLEGLGANSGKIRTGASIDNIETTEKGVRVHLSDGSVEEGSIIIGADGVHSKTRDISTRPIYNYMADLCSHMIFNPEERVAFLTLITHTYLQQCRGWPKRLGMAF